MAETSSQQNNVNFDLQQKLTLQNQRIAEAKRNLEFLNERFDTQKNITFF